MKRNLILLFAFVVLMVAPLAAAQTAPVFDPGTVDVIMAGALGITVVGLTEMLKRWLKAQGLGSYLISLGVSAAATAYYLVKAGGFAVLPFVGYTVFVFLAANGIYKSLSKSS